LEKFVKGDIVVFNFPFSDFSSYKKRPSLVVADLQGDDIILCEITSKNRNDGITLKKEETVKKRLPVDCYVRASRLFTVDNNIIEYKLDRINTEKILEVQNRICEIFTR